MSLRTFTVFQDVPSADSSKAGPANTLNATSPVLASKPVNTNHATTLTTAEKENVHPLTGERAGPSNNNTKKRKTSVLATKVHAPLSAKKQKESKEDSTESNPEAKKRKSSTSTSKAKSGGKKDGKAASSRKSTKRSTRRVSPMPKVDEEAEAERERITQAEIDSRCYELTVKPLADLSQAYEQGSSLETPAVEEDKVKFRSVKESSLEPEIRDYFSSPPPQSSALPAGSDAAPPAVEGPAFSTPERKRIYAAFTFTSPSPTSERFSKATRANSVPPLQLV
ncbi:hypothetical protein LshimejAT787_2001280 [Lyophyllum shimeji]|uniref:Uncharacterized protein n=1 Tax=Lyophyllum shimeji TaxID=47721 RepID=A0A9P3Q080_LYOSH|nr:hypothetical protein LshimejAT787_2001280 [Lyophyllum shimeji]